MNELTYPFHISNDVLDYDFESISEQRIISKSIQFTPFADNALLYNLALGDVLPDGKLDDSIVSDNHDMHRVMATVFQALLLFFEHYPSKLVYFQGSDEEGVRTRLYRILIAPEFDKTTELFTVYGRCTNDSIEEFIPNRAYIGFIFQRKSS